MYYIRFKYNLKNKYIISIRIAKTRFYSKTRNNPNTGVVSHTPYWQHRNIVGSGGSCFGHTSRDSCTRVESRYINVNSYGFHARWFQIVFCRITTSTGSISHWWSRCSTPSFNWYRETVNQIARVRREFLCGPVTRSHLSSVSINSSNRRRSLLPHTRRLERPKTSCRYFSGRGVFRVLKRSRQPCLCHIFIYVYYSYLVRISFTPIIIHRY